VICFLETNIFSRFSLPLEIITDNGNRGFGTTKFKFGPLDLFGKGQTPHNRWIWRRFTKINHQVLRTS
jgi:hypothetical protein